MYTHLVQIFGWDNYLYITGLNQITNVAGVATNLPLIQIVGAEKSVIDYSVSAETPSNIKITPRTIIINPNRVVSIIPIT